MCVSIKNLRESLIHTQGLTKGIMINKTIEDVADENSCRYPLGEINEPPKYFCGQPLFINARLNPKGWLYCIKCFKLCIKPKEKT